MGYFLPEKNSLPLKMDGLLKMIFRFGIPYFQRRSVSFRECPFFFVGELLLEPETSVYKWLFQLEDEPNLCIGNGWKSPKIHEKLVV